jgi:altronate hydrolase
VAAGAASKSEALGHQEFILTYKTFEPVGPACLPGGAGRVTVASRTVEIVSN